MRRMLMLMLGCLLATSAAQAGGVSVAVDTGADRRAIDPRIYGINFGEASQLVDPGYTVRRWGGNATTRYNWQVDVHNTASDWFFQNIVDDSGSNLPDDSTTNQFIAATLAAGAEPIVTIGTIGWTPLPQREKKWGFSIAKYGPQTIDECDWGAPEWCTADAGNGECSVAGGFCNGQHIVGNDPGDTSFATGPAWAQDWVEYLVARHAGQVRYYALDNEPMLWNHTHRDVHPQPATFDEIWQKAVDYGTAIKQADADAVVSGPVTWGYCDLFGSAADNCHVVPDRAAHGGLPFVQWYLRQNCAHEDQHGVRPVDVLDLHYYPQGGFAINDDESPDVAARRLRSLKELYDPAWVSESWIADLGGDYAIPRLIPRVRAWIDAECPGMQLAITEYNWGGDTGISSALAQAEVLAIFGREGVDIATRWVAPTPGSRVERAFRLFLDYDGAGSRITGDSVRATSADVDTLGAYAVADDAGGRLMLLLFNKATSATAAQLDLGQPLDGAWTLYRFDAATDVSQVASGDIDGDTLTLAGLPARSANLLVLPLGGGTGGGTDIFADGFEGAP